MLDAQKMHNTSTHPLNKTSYISLIAAMYQYTDFIVLTYVDHVDTCILILQTKYIFGYHVSI